MKEVKVPKILQRGRGDKNSETHIKKFLRKIKGHFFKIIIWKFLVLLTSDLKYDTFKLFKKLFLKSHFCSLNWIWYFLKISKNGQKSPKKKYKNYIFVTKIANTFDFSCQKSKKNWSYCFSGLFTLLLLRVLLGENAIH